MVKLITADKKPLKVILSAHGARRRQTKQRVDLLVISDPGAAQGNGAIKKMPRSFKAQIDIVVYGQFRRAPGHSGSVVYPAFGRKVLYGDDKENAFA